MQIASGSKGQAVLIAQAAVTPTGTLDTDHVTSPNNRGGMLSYRINAIDALQSVYLTVYGVDAAGKTIAIYQGPVLNAVGEYVLNIIPGATASGMLGTTRMESLSALLPVEWFVRETFGDNGGAKSITRSLSVLEVV